MNTHNSNLKYLHLRLLAALLPAVPLSDALLAPLPALAQEGATSSALAGVALPRGAQRLEAAAVGLGAHLVAVGREKAVALQVLEDGHEAFRWTTRPGRGAFTRTAVESALQARGYKIGPIPDDIRDTNPFEPQFGLDAAPVNISSIDERSYFLARNSGQKKALLGMWIKGDERIVLGLVAVAYQPDASEAPLPSAASDAFLVKDISDAMKGIVPPRPPALPKMTPRPGTVRGVVKDASGKPIAGARIIVQSSIAGGIRTSHRGTSNTAGVYQVLVPAGVAEVVNADCSITYNGRSYLLPLHPADGESTPFNARRGHIEHFTIRTWGVADPSALRGEPLGEKFYGGFIRMLWMGDPAPGGMIEVTLKPVGAPLGGGKGRTLVLRYAHKGMGETFLNDIPLARYQMSARLLDSGPNGVEALPLRLKKTFQDGEPSSHLSVDFEPISGPLASLGRCGVQRFNVSIQP